jgi:hypothetical protein
VKPLLGLMYPAHMLDKPCTSDPWPGGSAMIELRKTGLFSNEWRGLKDGAVVGTLSRSAWRARGELEIRNEADLPDDVPVALQVFLGWIVLVRDDEEMASVAAAAS